MRKQTKIRILAILMAIFVISTIGLIFSNETKEMDFGPFIITVPSDSNITVGNGSASYFVCEDFNTGITITYMNSTGITSNNSLNTSNYTQVNTNDFTLNGAKLYKIYNNTTNSNEYLATYNTTGQYFAFAAHDQSTVVDIMNSLKVKTSSY